jgi:formylglycine-generating enzyme required for sulfatase activity
MDEFIARIAQAQSELTAEEIADIIWMVTLCARPQSSSVRKKPPTSSLRAKSLASTTAGKLVFNEALKVEEPEAQGQISRSPRGLAKKQAGLYPRRHQLAQALAEHSLASLPSQPQDDRARLSIRVPNARSLREDPLKVARALRPLIRKVPSTREIRLNEQATADLIAESKIWQPVTEPQLEPWLDLALVVDESKSMLIWQQSVKELRRWFRYYGAFRDVHTWGLVERNGHVGIRPDFWTNADNVVLRRPQELIDPTGRRLILVLTDCVSTTWRTDGILEALRVWTEGGPVAIIQMLPQWLWDRTALRHSTATYLYGLEPGSANYQLKRSVIRQSLSEDPALLSTGIAIPVLTPKPDQLESWSKMLTGRGSAVQTVGVVLNPKAWNPTSLESEANVALTAQRRTQEFRLASSPMAWRLARLLAASPVISLPVIRLIQETLLPKSSQEHVAEVLLGGILKPQEQPTFQINPDDIVYEFIDPEVRTLLLDETPVPDTINVLSKYIRRKLDKTLDEFLADLHIDNTSNDLENAELTQKLRPFALVTAEVLKRKGGRYADLAKQLEDEYASPTHIDKFIFKTITVTSDFFRERLQTEEQEGEACSFSELLENRVPNQQETSEACSLERLPLEMILIPRGRFLMGSPVDEPDAEATEHPQHDVALPDIWMSRCLITQKQWQFVAAFPRINRDLPVDPFHFNGENLPVERVSWLEAIEFCDRLSLHTHRTYRLPSEAEWEYACRGQHVKGDQDVSSLPSLPFHYGETITPELANYDSNYIYEGRIKGLKGTWLRSTTVVKNFSPNAFGLYDMHGNVAEWCMDHWHKSYDNSPTDGSPWQDENLSQEAPRVVRGGSWALLPRYCRCAYRKSFRADERSYDIGFRVVLEKTS